MAKEEIALSVDAWRRKLGLRRDEWPLLRARGYKTMGAMVVAVLNTVETKDLVRLLRELGVKRIVVFPLEGTATALMVHRNAIGGWLIILDTDQPINRWIEDIGHEIGHLLVGVHSEDYYEEVFAEEFGIAWSQVPEHRLQAKKLIIELRKHKGVNLLAPDR